MLGSAAGRSFTAGLRQTSVPRFTTRLFQPLSRSQLCTLTSRRTELPVRASSQALVLRQRYATKGFAGPDLEHEKEVGKQKLTPHPELVSATSSVHSLFSEVGVEETKKDADMSAGIRGDLVRCSSSLHSIGVSFY